ncbi:MAG TPA: TIGR01777 family oxidoreductase [bacterium]|nr:TIGR01777 family oxidoreductase [bacterium]
MPLFEKESRIEVPVEELFRWHTQGPAFERLAPPWEKVHVLERTGGLQDGGKVVLQVRQGPVALEWTAVHRDYIEGKQFVDEQVRGPFARWIHTHQTRSDGPQASILKDHIEYQPPFGPLGALASGYLRSKIERTFRFRHDRTRQDLERLHPFASQKPLRIAMTGASGLVGTALSQFLACGGHEILPMVRRKPRPGEKAVHWDPVRMEMDQDALEGVDAVVHLAGENIGVGRWSASRKESIRRSRVEGTRFLSETLASLKNPPRTLICSSAIGFYGNRGDEALDEKSAPGQGFLPDVCQEWETACGPARDAGIRVVNLRTGIVLTPLGGALAKMLPPFRMGGGGIIGSGRQWMSWISLEDLVGIFHYALHAKGLQGPVNAVAPTPMTNRDLTKVLGKVLGRPTLFPLPGFMVKALFGEMGEALLLEGQRVLPQRLQEAGFPFLHSDLESALRWELGR